MHVNKNIGKTIAKVLGVFLVIGIIYFVLTGLKETAIPKGLTNEQIRSVLLGSEPVIQDNVAFSFEMRNMGSSIPYNPSDPVLTDIHTNGTYQNVQLTLNSQNLEESKVIVKGVELVDQAGRIYKPIGYHWSGSVKASYFIDYVLNLKPSIDSKSGLLFETSKESTDFNLKLEYSL